MRIILLHSNKLFSFIFREFFEINKFMKHRYRHDLHKDQQLTTLLKSTGTRCGSEVRTDTEKRKQIFKRPCWPGELLHFYQRFGAAVRPGQYNNVTGYWHNIKTSKKPQEEDMTHFQSIRI